MSEPFTPAARERPQPDELGFDRRLIGPGRLLQLAGSHGLKLGIDGAGQAWLDCAQCGKGVEQLTDASRDAYTIQPARLLSGTLRHLVMSHGLSLSGGTS